MIRIKDVTPRVKALLKEDRLLADNDEKLIVLIWQDELMKLDIYPNHEIALFFSTYMSHVLTPAESIRRSRQALEFANPELRGDTYEVRHGKRRKEVKQDVKTVVFEEILDSKYEQITPEIGLTLKQFDEVYFTHPDFVNPSNYDMFSNNQWAKEAGCKLGCKYTIENIEIFENKVWSIRINTFFVNPAQFSILSKNK
jgi:hypothetical protein